MGKYQNFKNQDNKKFKDTNALLHAIIKGDIVIRSNDEKLPLTDDSAQKELNSILSEIVEENNKYFDLFDKAPAGYVILNAVYQIIEINETGKYILKNGPSKIIGESFSNFVSSEYIESFRYFLKNLKAGKKDENCRLKIINEPDIYVFRGTTGGEEIVEKQTFRILFFHSDNNTDKDSYVAALTKLIEPNVSENKAGTPEKPAAIEEILGKMTVLVADDDEVARIYLEELLKSKCRKVLFAKNGKEAVEILQDYTAVDLILMDIKMPVMDGYTATIKIKGMNKNVVIIAQTAYALASDREKALAAGCNDYLAKPLIKKDLFAVIEKFFK